MCGAKRPEPSSDPVKWEVFYAALVKLLKNQQGQLETLLSQRKFLEEWIKKQHEAWTANQRVYETHLSDLKSCLEEKEMELLMVASKSELMMGLKHREAFVRKLKLEETEDELADFRALFDLLTASLKKTDEPDQGTESRRRTRSSTSKIAAADTESERLKLKYEKLVSEKNAEISMLSKEKTFIWNQFNMLESKLTKKLKGKQAEVDQANNKFTQVCTTVEQFQSSNIEKDEVIEKLKARVSELLQKLEGLKKKSQVEVDQANDKFTQVCTTVEQLQSSNLEKDETIAKLKDQLQSSNTGKDEVIEKLEAQVSELSQELEGLKKKSQVVVTPALRSCKGTAVKSVKKESTDKDVRPNGKGSRSSKRKRKGDGDDAVIILESPPKLFTSSFRVPKLKNSSAPV